MCQPGQAFAPRATARSWRRPRACRDFQSAKSEADSRSYLVGVVGLAGGVLGLRLELGEIDVVELAVIGARADLEIDGTVLGDVGMASVDEGLDHRDLLGDVFDRAGLDVRGQQAERKAVGMELIGPLLREVAQRLARGEGAADGLIVDVRDVADVLHLQAGDLEGAAQDVLHGEGAEIADVGRSVDRGSAAVHASGSRGRASGATGRFSRDMVSCRNTGIGR
jgi:hypothetical protein